MIYFKELDTPEITTKERNQLLFRASQTKDSCKKHHIACHLSNYHPYHLLS
jgi:hypothetical protein